MVSGAVSSPKRSKKIIQDLNFIKETYVEYLLGPNEEELKKAEAIFSRIEDYILEISTDRKILDAKLAEELKKA